jgi:hypothetical protein
MKDLDFKDSTKQKEREQARILKLVLKKLYRKNTPLERHKGDILLLLSKETPNYSTSGNKIYHKLKDISEEQDKAFSKAKANLELEKLSEVKARLGERGLANPSVLYNSLSLTTFQKAIKELANEKKIKQVSEPKGEGMLTLNPKLAKEFEFCRKEYADKQNKQKLN